eukprot:12429622-Karenia_brevis.AAC.1
MATRWPKTTQDGPRSTPRRVFLGAEFARKVTLTSVDFKVTLSGAQDGSRWPQDGRRRPKMAQDRLQDVLSWEQNSQ